MNRAKQRRIERQQERSLAIQRADWDSVWPDQDIGHIGVCLRDSYDVGNSIDETKCWVAKYMPEQAGRECIPATLVLKAIEQDLDNTRRRRAVAVVHRAILRSRQKGLSAG